METLIFTAVQNIPQRNNAEEIAHVDKISDTNRGNFLELLHLRCRDIPWLSFKLEQSLKKHTVWLSPDIQNEIIDIAACLDRKKHFMRTLLMLKFSASCIKQLM